VLPPNSAQQPEITAKAAWLSGNEKFGCFSFYSKINCDNELSKFVNGKFSFQTKAVIACEDVKQQGGNSVSSRLLGSLSG
jgi:hypothetical protein